MPRQSMSSRIKQLEAEIVSWQGRTWKADDSLAIANRQLTELKSRADALENDKRWLKTLIQNLSVPSQERTRF